MSAIIKFPLILTLTSTHHVTLTMCQLYIKHITELGIDKIDPPILKILFSPDLLLILLIMNTNYMMLIRC